MQISPASKKYDMDSNLTIKVYPQKHDKSSDNKELKTNEKSEQSNQDENSETRFAEGGFDTLNLRSRWRSIVRFIVIALGRNHRYHMGKERRVPAYGRGVFFVITHLPLPLLLIIRE